MNFKKNLKHILLEKEWLTGTLLPIILGVVVFYLISLLGGNNSYAILWGCFAAYMLFGGFISVSKSISGLFEKINIYLGLISINFGVLSLIFWPEIKIAGTPILIIGIVITVIAFLGLGMKTFGKKMAYYDDPYY